MANYPKIGIRPVIDGRQGGVRESLEEKTMALAAAVAGVGALEFAVKASEEGKIYGSVTNAQVAEALAAKGVTVEKKHIVLETVKALGEYVAVAKLHREVSVEIPVTVVAEAAE